MRKELIYCDVCGKQTDQEGLAGKDAQVELMEGSMDIEIQFTQNDVCDECAREIATTLMVAWGRRLALKEVHPVEATGDFDAGSARSESNAAPPFAEKQ